MKALILNLVEEAIAAEHGEVAWDSLPDAADADPQEPVIHQRSARRLCTLHATSRAA